MSDFFKNIVRLPPPHTARSYSQLTPVYTADEVAKTVASFEAELAKANERVKELEKGNKSCAVAIREIIAKGDIGPLLVTGPELDEIVNKFAIETRAKALQSLLNKKCPVSGYVIRDKESREIIAEELEQLRKEQASD